jgi:dihydroorotate dehydrogenase (fumarate)
VAASTISSHTDRIVMAEEAGAGALVIRSLFEEQVAMDSYRMTEALTQNNDSFAEATTLFPRIKHGGPKEHLMWVEKARRAVKMPLIGSLNAASPGAWTHYARQLADTGVDALELNYYTIGADPTKTALDIEKILYGVVEQVRAEVKLPIAVKLSPFYTSMANVVSELDKRGVQGVVLFNRFLQPDIDPMTESTVNEMVYSTSAELKLPLRWVALLYGRTRLDLSLTTGVHKGPDAIKALLAGATTVQMAAALLTHGVSYLSTILLHLRDWMGDRGYQSIDDFRGKLSQKNCDDPLHFERAHYVNLIMSQK